MRTPSRRTLTEAAVFCAILIVVLIAADLAHRTPTTPAPTPAATLSRASWRDLPCAILLTTAQGLLVVKTPAGDWAMVGPTGELVIWIHDPDMIADLERQAAVNATRKVFQQ